MKADSSGSNDRQQLHDGLEIDPMIFKALEFSARVHVAQLRKGTDIPYISHPAAVGMILQRYDCSSNAIAAGILHDVVEDGKVSYEEIVSITNQAVADIVKGCSEPDKSKSWIPRKLHTIEYLRNAPLEIKQVAAADKLHNVLSMLSDIEGNGERVWARFNRGREDQEWYYRSVVDSLRLDNFSKHPLHIALSKAVEKVFSDKKGIQE